MIEAENNKNWALEELMNYVNSLADTQTNVSYSNSLQATMPRNETENYRNWALDELMNYLDTLAENPVTTSDSSSFTATMPQSDRSVIAVQSNEVLNILQEKPQEIHNKFFHQVAVKNKQQVALAPSNMTNLVALIQQLRSSNSNLVKRVTDLSQAMTQFHQALESQKAQNQVAQTMLLDKDRALETACQTIECQQNLIETLNAELASHKEFVAQSQAIYSEQSYQLLEAKNTCRDLRTRLHREQQHSVQLKFALLLDQIVTATTPSNSPQTNVPRTNDGEAIATSRLWLVPLVASAKTSTQVQPEQLPLPGFHPRWLP